MIATPKGNREQVEAAPVHMKEEFSSPSHRATGTAAAVFVLIAAILLGIGWWYYRAETDEITRDKYQTLAAIGELKAQQIQEWRHERLSESKRMAEDGLLLGALGKSLGAPGDKGLRKQLASCLKLELSDPDHAHTLIFDPEGNLIAANDDDAGVATDATRRAMHDAVGTNQPVFSDFYRASAGPVHIDIAAPVHDEGGRLLAVLILRHKADSYLFPLLRSWPVPSRSAETLLIQREGDKALFVNDLRYQNHPALSLNIPLTDTRVPAVQAILGKQGIFEGRDYRGVEVLSDLLPVHGSPWFIEPKVDSEEILAEARARATLILIIVGLFVLLAAGLIIGFFRLRQVRMLAGLLEAERQRANALEVAQAVLERHRDIIQTASEGYCLVDMQGRIQEVNDAFCAMNGYSEQELLSMAISDLEADMSPPAIGATIHLITALGQHRFESRHRRKDGGVIDVEANVQHRPSENLIVSFIHDITERKKIERALQDAETIAREKTALLESIIESPEGVVIFALDNSYRYLEFTSTHKATMKKIWGREIAAGMNMLDVISDPGQREKAKRNFDRTMRGERLLLVEEYGDEALHRSCYESRYSPIMDANGKATGLTVFVIDVSDRVRAEAEVKKSEAKFRTIIESSPVAMTGLDSRMNATFLNPEFVRLFGYTTEELPTISQWWTNAYPDPEYRKSVADAWQVELDRAKQSGKPIPPVEVTVRCKDGIDKVVVISTAPLSDAPEDGYVVSIVDVTGRKQAEQKLVRSERLLRESQETARVGYYINTLATGLWESSPTLDNIFGIDRDFVRDTAGWSNLMHPDDREKTVGYFLRIIANRESFRMDYRIIRLSDGELRWMAGYGNFEYDDSGKPVRLVGCIQDITERKVAEEDLRAKSEALSKANEELKAHIRLARELAGKAEAATHAKSEFLAVMSHELRTPLNGVLGFAEILASTKLDGEQQDFVQTIRDSGEHLLGIVNDILDFSSIEKDSMRLESAPVFISNLMDVSVAAIRKTAADKGLEFRCETAPGVPEQITGDARRIRQILINLLGNAVKFTPQGEVVLRVAPAVDGDRKCLDFSIADTGIGIPPETLERLFKPFVQADSSLHRSFDGAGLGLAISLRLAEMMGGTIAVSSISGKGSTFTFRLPLESGALPPIAPAARELPPAVPPVGGLVLVVEDDPMNSLLAGKFLESIGMRVDFAANGMDALAAFAPKKYAAIFMDMQMPVMNGMEATIRIRGIEAGTGTRVPIIALTANVMPGDRERCLAASMDDVLTKPFKKDEMAAKVALFAC